MTSDLFRYLDNILIKAGSIAGAGSFGGFLKRTSVPETFFGLTAAHCLPGCLVGMPVCSPSTVEVTARLKRLVRYTTLATPQERLHVIQQKDAEVHQLLQQFRFHEYPDGVEFLDPANNFQQQMGLLSGDNLGVIVTSNFRNDSGLLHRYDQVLRSTGLPFFSASVYWRTRVDFSIFTCNEHRCVSFSYIIKFLF